MHRPLNQGAASSESIYDAMSPFQTLYDDHSEPLEEPAESTPEADDDDGATEIPSVLTKSKSDVSVDFLTTPMPRVELELGAKRFLVRVCATIAFTTVFTIGFYCGLTVDTVYEATGSAAMKSDELVDTYNTISGYVMALIEVFLTMHMDQFMPVLDVYVHNSLFFLRRKTNGQPKTKCSRLLHTALLFLFPIVLTLTMDNSLRGLQASHSSTGIKRIMSIDDLNKEQSPLELIKVNPAQPDATRLSVYDTILKNAIRQQPDPFTFDTQSVCQMYDLKEAEERQRLATHDVDTTNVVYGFVPREWNREAISFEVVPTSSFTVSYEKVTNANKTKTPILPPANFSIQTAYEMLVQAKIQLERAQGEAMVNPYPCVESDGRQDLDIKSNQANASEGEWIYNHTVRLCEGAPTSLFTMGSFYDKADATIENFVVDMGSVLAKTFPNISREETTVTLETYDLTPHIRVEAMRIDIAINQSVFADMEIGCESANGSCAPVFSYSKKAATWCGSNGCVFVDETETFLLPREIGVTPYVTNCSLDSAHIHYNALFRGFYPSDCTRVTNTAFIYGFGSYFGGDTYNSSGESSENAGKMSAEDYDDSREVPFITGIKRHGRFTFAKVTWATEDLATRFDAKCGLSKQHQNCSGLWYQLQPSGRFLFAGEAALSTQKLAHVDLHSPITLVQLNSPTVSNEWSEEPIILERLSPSNFRESDWGIMKDSHGAALQGSSCSRLMDSYLKHIETNNFYLQYPLQAMYTSFFYFLMENAAATQLQDGQHDPSREVNTTEEIGTDRLGHAKLQGDVQVRSIRVIIPKNAFRSTFGGCIVIAIMVLVIVIVPARLSEYFEIGVTKAQRFVVLRNDTMYPDAVYEKMLLDPATEKSVLFDEVKIDSLALVHKADRDRVVHL